MDSFLIFHLLHIDHRTRQAIWATIRKRPLEQTTSLYECLNQIRANYPLLVAQAEERAKLALGACQNLGYEIVRYIDQDYPPKLKILETPPAVLFCENRRFPLGTTLGVVGTRSPDRYGTAIVQQFVPTIATVGASLVSGFAEGIDSLSHRVACRTKIPNFAILGAGLDVEYPRRHHSELKELILLSGGNLITEYAPGAAPKRDHFPWRNRLIAALSDCLWIVQGTAKSGTQHTALYGLEIGTRILVTPGEVTNPLSYVPNRLLREGAHPVLNSFELAEHLLQERQSGHQ